MFESLRVKIPSDVVKGAPQWAQTVAEIHNTAVEAIAQALERADGAAIKTLVSRIAPSKVTDASPLFIPEAAKAKALWVGRCVAVGTDETTVVAPAVRWTLANNGAQIRQFSDAVDGDTVYDITFCWVT